MTTVLTPAHRSRARAMGTVLAILVLAATLLSLTPPPAAHALTGDCGAVLVDEPGLVDASWRAAIDEQADLLADEQDVLLLVRLLEDTGGAGVDDWAEASLGACPSWQREDGSSHAKLLLVVVSLADREVGSYYGIDLATALNAHKARVHDDVMAPLLDAGRFGEALFNGVTEYARVLDVDVAGVPGSSNGTTTAPRTSGGPSQSSGTSSGSSNSGRRSEGAAILLILLGMLAVTLLVLASHAGITRLRQAMRERDERRQERADATAGCIAARSASREQFYEAQQRWDNDLGPAVTVALGGLHHGDRFAERLETEVDQAEQALAAAAEAVNEAAATTPDGEAGESLDALPTADLLKLRRAWERTQRLSQQASDELDDVAALLVELDDTRTRLAADRKAASDAVADARRAVEQAGDGGPLDGGVVRISDMVTRLQHADGLLAQAAAMLESGDRPGDAAVLVDQAAATGRQVPAELAARLQLAAALPGRLDATHDRNDQADQAAAVALRRLESMRSDYARSVWDDLADAPREHQGSSQAAAAMLDQAGEAIVLRRHEAAAQLLDRCDEAIAATAAVTAEIVRRCEDLEQAEHDLPDALSQAEAALDDLEQVDDLEQLTADRRRELAEQQRVGARILEQAREALAAEAPDPILSLERAHRAERRLVELARDASNEVEEQQRRARAAISDAEARLRKARSYGRTYGRDHDLAEVATLLALANDSLDDPREAARLADQAARTAADASRHIRSQRDAEEAAARRAARRSSSSSYGSSSSFGGGGSSSFGGGGFGGGGSSSFGGGGGGFGGGGSSGW